jgi:uncharacterized membrane protein
MEESFREVASIIALAIEALVVFIITLGAVEALVRTFGELPGKRMHRAARRETWLRFAAWILLALEFALAADIVRTAIAPSWDDIGKLAAIAGIRTVLNWFLGRDLAEYAESNEDVVGAPPPRAN